jgi:hypothetical protein
MKLIQQESLDKIVHAWLRAEWSKHDYNKDFAGMKKRLIDHPNFDDAADNDTRIELLRMHRANMLDPLPLDTVWYTGQLEPTDLDRLHVVASGDWLPISNNTYTIRDTVSNAGSTFEHAEWISEIYATLPNPLIDAKFITVASAESSPLTIIEGNHRGSALIKYYLEHSQRERVTQDFFVGISPAMKNYIWHFESRDPNNPNQFAKR